MRAKRIGTVQFLQTGKAGQHYHSKVFHRATLKPGEHIETALLRHVQVEKQQDGKGILFAGAWR